MMVKRAVIFANGTIPDLEAARRLLHEDDYWIAADGGCAHALDLGRAPDVLIGDFDSLPDFARDPLRIAGTRVKTFPDEKDETDLELGVWFALEEGYTAIRILGGLGGRTDQILANLSLLTDPALREFDIRIDDGREEAVRIGGETVLRGAPGEVVSLLPWGVPAEGVVTEGLKFPLRGETLIPYKTRGVSNRMLSDRAVISVERGVLICLHAR